MHSRYRVCTALLLCALFAALVFPNAASAAQQAPPQISFAQAGEQAMNTLLHVYYAGQGVWRACNHAACQTSNSDWGDDSATYALYLRWKTRRDPQVPRIMKALEKTAPLYQAPCGGPDNCSSWSDTPEWDAVALMREYDVLGDPNALVRAENAYRFTDGSHAYALGACPAIPYQRPYTGEYRLKTLETTSNAIKAAILLYRATHNHLYLQQAIAQYAAARQYFLDPEVPLYTVHVIDDGTNCRQIPHRFFASVNGNMIWNGIALSQLTGSATYYNDAIATAKAVDADLSDSNGVFTDLQGDNDVAEPLVEAMEELAVRQHQAFAKAWILRNATAALASRASDGTFERFFDGPPDRNNSLWESNGGIALEIAASALSPRMSEPLQDGWHRDTQIGAALTSLPATITFDGSAIALVGTIGRQCQASHVRVFIDGVETFDQTGLWQNKAMPDGRQPGVLFAWRWPTSGRHTIVLEPGPDVARSNILNLSSFAIVDEGQARVAARDGSRVAMERSRHSRARHR
jgi:hypothetical protein